MNPVTGVRYFSVQSTRSYLSIVLHRSWWSNIKIFPMPTQSRGIRKSNCTRLLSLLMLFCCSKPLLAQTEASDVANRFSFATVTSGKTTKWIMSVQQTGKQTTVTAPLAAETIQSIAYLDFNYFKMVVKNGSEEGIDGNYYYAYLLIPGESGYRYLKGPDNKPQVFYNVFTIPGSCFFNGALIDGPSDVDYCLYSADGNIVRRYEADFGFEEVAGNLHILKPLDLFGTKKELELVFDRQCKPVDITTLNLPKSPDPPLQATTDAATVKSTQQNVTAEDVPNATGQSTPEKNNMEAVVLLPETDHGETKRSAIKTGEAPANTKRETTSYHFSQYTSAKDVCIKLADWIELTANDYSMLESDCMNEKTREIAKKCILPDFDYANFISGGYSNTLYLFRRFNTAEEAFAGFGALRNNFNKCAGKEIFINGPTGDGDDGLVLQHIFSINELKGHATKKNNTLTIKIIHKRNADDYPASTKVTGYYVMVKTQAVKK